MNWTRVAHIMTCVQPRIMRNSSGGRFLSFVAIMVVLFVATEGIAIGESAVITLVFPWGARQAAMGEVGVALADDETALFYNPAGLGTDNDRWNYVSGSNFYEPLLPAFGIDDLWHRAAVVCYRPKAFDIGVVGISFNYLSFGENAWTDELGRELGKAHSYEMVLGLSWGTELFRTFGVRHSAGLSAKYVCSALAPGFGPYDEGIGRTFAVDVGYLAHHPIGLRLGLSAVNMGPSIFYISRDEADPIPFTLNAAIGFKRSLNVQGVEICGIAFEHRLDVELVKNYIDKRPEPFWRALEYHLREENRTDAFAETIRHTGFEATILNTIHFRTGFMDDTVGSRQEWHHGMGVTLYDHVSIDAYWIHSPTGSIARDGQWGLSLSVKRILDWKRSDLHWWRKPPSYSGLILGREE